MVSAVAYGAVSEYASATGNFAARAEAWRVGIDYVVADPVRLLFGTGLGFFAQGYLAEQGAVATLHSAPVQIMTETGLVGLGLLVWASLGTLYRGVRYARPAALGFSAAVGAFMIHQVFDNAFLGFSGVVLFELLALVARESRAAVPVSCSRDIRDRLEGAGDGRA